MREKYMFSTLRSFFKKPAATNATQYEPLLIVETNYSERLARVLESKIANRPELIHVQVENSMEKWIEPAKVSGYEWVAI